MGILKDLAKGRKVAVVGYSHTSVKNYLAEHLYNRGIMRGRGLVYSNSHVKLTDVESKGVAHGLNIEGSIKAYFGIRFDSIYIMPEVQVPTTVLTDLLLLLRGTRSEDLKLVFLGGEE